MSIDELTADVVVARAAVHVHESRQSFEELIRRYGGVEKAYVYAEAYADAIKALQGYQPEKGAAT